MYSRATQGFQFFIHHSLVHVSDRDPEGTTRDELSDIYSISVLKDEDVRMKL